MKPCPRFYRTYLFKMWSRIKLDDGCARCLLYGCAAIDDVQYKAHHTSSPPCTAKNILVPLDIHANDGSSTTRTS
jgi:hypothetical protein